MHVSKTSMLSIKPMSRSFNQSINPGMSYFFPIHPVMDVAGYASIQLIILLLRKDELLVKLLGEDIKNIFEESKK